MSWTNVKSKFVTLTTVGVSITTTAVPDQPVLTRLRGFNAICSGAGGQIILSDVSISAGVGFRGTDRMTVYVPVSTAGGVENYIQAGGITFNNGIFVTVPTGGLITLFYD